MTQQYKAQEWYSSIKIDDLEELKLDFAVMLEKALNAAGKNRSELAAALSVSPARITTILRGDANLTLEVMHNLATALGNKLHIHFAPIGTKVHSFTVFPGQSNVFNAPIPHPPAQKSLPEIIMRSQYAEAA